jgi:hypothetical protein
MEMFCSRPIWIETHLAGHSSPRVIFRLTGEDARRSIGSVNLRFSRSGLKGDALEPVVEFVEGEFTLQPVAFLAVANLAVEGG